MLGLAGVLLRPVGVDHEDVAQEADQEHPVGRDRAGEPLAVFRKSVHSAMFAREASGRSLESWLRAHGIERLLITGIRTEQCCETTTRHASDLGFDVRYVSDATLTFAMRAASGRE